MRDKDIDLHAWIRREIRRAISQGIQDKSASEQDAIADVRASRIMDKIQGRPVLGATTIPKSSLKEVLSKRLSFLDGIS